MCINTPSGLLVSGSTVIQLTPLQRMTCTDGAHALLHARHACCVQVRPVLPCSISIKLLLHMLLQLQSDNCGLIDIPCIICALSQLRGDFASIQGASTCFLSWRAAAQSLQINFSIVGLTMQHQS